MLFIQFESIRMLKYAIIIITSRRPCWSKRLLKKEYGDRDWLLGVERSIKQALDVVMQHCVSAAC